MAETNGVCCEFIEILKTKEDTNIAQNISPNDINAFLTYCQLWQHKQCLCLFSNDEIIEKFHSLINEWINISIDMIQNLVDDNQLYLTTNNLSQLQTITNNNARRWSMENKEKLLLAIVKIFSSNMPLYVTYKHLFSNNKDCCDTDTISLVQSYCQMHQQDNDMSIDLLRNICNFIENNGMSAIKICFTKATPETLPITMAHVLFNMIFNLRIWLNPTVIIDHISAMRPHVIKYMCQLSDKDLRLAGAKSTTELMYNSFKDAFDTNQYKIDIDGLTLAYKYFMCSTLTIRLCGIAQMNNQISFWNEYNSNSTNINNNKVLNELAEWFIENRIIEHLFGPNLHVEVIKRSQDIMNFLAFTNQINEKHLDIIWSAAQLKHCSKPVLDMLLVLQKNLYPEALVYLSHLLYQMDLNSHTEQTFLLSSTITKSLWSLMLNYDYQREKRDDNTTLVFQPLVPETLSSTGSEEEMTTIPGRLKKRHNESMETKPHSDEDEDEEDDDDDNDEIESSKKVPRVKQNQFIRLNQNINNKLNRIKRQNFLNSKQRRKLKNAAVLLAKNNNISKNKARFMKLNSYHYQKRKGKAFKTQKINKNKIIKRNSNSSVKVIEENDDGYVIRYGNSNTESDDDQQNKNKSNNKNNVTSDEEVLEITKSKKANNLKNISKSDVKINENDIDEEDIEDDDSNDDAVAIINSSQNDDSESEKINDKNKFGKLNKHKNGENRLNIVKASKKSFDLTKTSNEENNNESPVTSQVSLHAEIDSDVYRCQNFSKNHHRVNDDSSDVSGASPKNLNEFDEDDQDVANQQDDDEEDDEEDITTRAVVDNDEEEEDDDDDDDEEDEDDDDQKSTNDENDGDEEIQEVKLKRIEKDNDFDVQNIKPSKTSRNSRNSNSTSSSSNKKIFNFGDICKEGNTFLWDIIQDDKANYLSEKLVREAEKQLHSLVCYQTDKRIRIRFIEGCLNNLRNNKSCTVSLRLLSKLFSSFQSCRNAYNIDIYRVIAWADETQSMMKIFFDNLKQFSLQYQTFKKQSNANTPSNTPPSTTTSSTSVSTNLFNKFQSNLQTEIQVRLNFLTYIFSTMASPKEFELTSEQVEQLWDCLIIIDEYQDDLFNWFLNQAKNKDQHAINIETFKLIFMNKIPLLDPNKFSPIALHLYQELFKIYKLSYHHSNSNTIISPLSFKQLEATCMDYISKLAFKSANNEVSVSAIQFLNSHYTQSDTINKELENEFIKRCMFYLNDACANLENDTQTSIIVLKRGLYLLKNHIDLFQKRFSYQLRVWYINGNGIISHLKALQDVSQIQQISLICQLDIINNYKITFKVNVNDYVGDLKAVIRELIIQDLKSKQFSNVDLLKLLENEDDYIFKYIVNGQELVNNMDCRLVSDLQLKELQIIHVTVINFNRLTNKTYNANTSGSSSSSESIYENHNDKRKNTSHSKLTHDLVPMVILLNEPYFSNLFHILHVISAFKPKIDDLSYDSVVNIEYNISSLASKTWEIIMLLPTNRNLLNIFIKPEMINLLDDNYVQRLLATTTLDRDCETDLPVVTSACSYRLLYYLQIIDIISKYCDDFNNTTIASALINSTYNNLDSINYRELLQVNCWKQTFIEKNCLKQLYSLFHKHMKYAFEHNKWNEAFLDCLHIIMKLLVYYLVDNRVNSSSVEQQGGTSGSSLVRNLSNSEQFETPRKKTKRNNNNNNSGSNSSVSSSNSATNLNCESTNMRNSIHVLTLTKINNVAIIYDLIINDIELFLNLIFNLQTIISSSDYVYLANKNFIKIEILYYSMQLLGSCLLSTTVIESNETTFGDIVCNKFFLSKFKQQRILWLKALLLDCQETLFRKEVCNWLYKISIISNSRVLNETSQQKSNILLVILSDLLNLLSIATKFTPNVNYSRSKKELLNSTNANLVAYNAANGLTCKDYFFLLTALIQNLNSFSEFSNYEIFANNDFINIENLMEFVATQLNERDYYEKTNNDEDEVLIGLLNLGISLMKHNPNYKSNQELAKNFINDLYGYLFELPSASKRYLPKCKSSNSRTLCFDLLIELARENFENYKHLHTLLLTQHTNKSHAPYPWDYWPRDDVRSICGYVGLTNLGATCYMATCMQHLYMINEARSKILNAKISTEGKRYENMLSELQKMFAYLLESERKAYNPKNFCKVYTMDNQPLNTAEQKDMTEFFTDLISKIEEMSPELKHLVKNLFGGTITNLVISLDCPHVSCMLEEFYTVRCQVAGMKDLYDSLNEITVKDTLEGDNMYTCSKCGKKVRAEKRACFRKLPKILCFNTMRYTFNMVTMLKEKVNTHFSFPLQLDMSGYMEKNLISPEKLSNELTSSSSSTSENAVAATNELETNSSAEESYNYELIGVTVHTGTAEGGHYYSFIRDRTAKDECDQDKWYLFNDAEVKQFDPSQLPAECFGGETSSKTYDSATDRFMDLSFEKTHSAYMLFYERIPLSNNQQIEEVKEETNTIYGPAISHDLLNWIWEDNMKFIQDRNTFEHSYFNFVWQMCDYIPRSFNKANSPTTSSAAALTTIIPPTNNENINLLATQLGCSFILETYIHAKEKPTMLQWIESLTKCFNANKQTCKWFLEHMCNDLCWAAKVFLRCPNSTIRQMFQRLLIHVMNRIKVFNNDNQQQKLATTNSEDKECIEKFITKLLELIDFSNQTLNISKYNIRYMSEYFMFLHEFVRAGSDECKILINSGAINKCIKFYLLKRLKSAPNLNNLLNLNNHQTGDNQPTTSSKANETNENQPQPQISQLILSSGSDDETSDIIPLHDQKSKIKVFEKIIALISILVENSSIINTGNNEIKLNLSTEDRILLLGEHDELTFLYKSILDDINLHYIRNIIYSIVRYEPHIANKIIDMIANSIKRMHNDNCTPFFNILGNNTMGLLEYECNLSDLQSNESSPTSLQSNGLPNFTELIVPKLPILLESAPYHALQWLSTLVTCNLRIHNWCLDNLKLWCKQCLLAHKQTNIRFSAAVLLANLIPNKLFRDTYTANRNMYIPFKPTHHNHHHHSNHHHQQRNDDASVVPTTSSNANTQQNHKSMFNVDFNSTDCKSILHRILEHLFTFMGELVNYVDKDQHAHNTRLVQYFAFLIFCLTSKEEKLLFKNYIQLFWSSFFPIISNIHTVSNLNKQAALHFFYQTLVSCNENIEYVLSRPKIKCELPSVTISIDHEDNELITYNRNCLHIYYGIIRLCCHYSREYSRQMSLHGNFMWAFKYILPYTIQYPLAVQELNKCILLFIDKSTHSNQTTASSATSSQNSGAMASVLNNNNEAKAINVLKENLLNIILHDIDPKTCWQSIILVLKSLIETQNDAHMALFRKGLNTLTNAFQNMCIMHHEATACNLMSDLIECMSLIEILLKTALTVVDLQYDAIKQVLTVWKEKQELCKRLILLLNFYNNLELRLKAIEVLRLIITLAPNDTIISIVHLLNLYYTQANQISAYPCQLYANFAYSVSPKPVQQQQQNQLFDSNNSAFVSTFNRAVQQSQNLQNYMGPFYPISKYALNTICQVTYLGEPLNFYHHYSVPASAATTSSSISTTNSTSCLATRPTKPMFNLFLKLSQISHTHLNGNVFIIDHDYENQLNEHFIPYFNFFDQLVRLSFKNELLNRELINLIIIIAQQALLININSIPFITEQLNNIINSSRISEAPQLNETVRKYVLDSPYLIGYIQTIMYDFRHLLNKRDIYEFVQTIFTFDFVLSRVDLKAILEESVKSMRDIKDSFDYLTHQIILNENFGLQKQSTMQIQQYEFKLNVLFGNTATIYIITSLHPLNEHYRNQIKNFLLQIHDYFRNKIFEIKLLISESASATTSSLSAEQQQQQQQESVVSTENTGDKNETDGLKTDNSLIENANQQPKKPKYESEQQQEQQQQQPTQKQATIINLTNLQRKFFESILPKLIQISQHISNSLNITTQNQTASNVSTTPTSTSTIDNTVQHKPQLKDELDTQSQSDLKTDKTDANK